MNILQSIDDLFLIIVIILLGLESVLNVLDRIGFLPRSVEKRYAAREKRLILSTLDEVGLVSRRPMIRQLTDYWDIRDATSTLNIESDLLELVRDNTREENVKVGLYTSIFLKYFIDLASLTSEPVETARLARLLGASIRDALSSLETSLHIDKIAASPGNPALAFAISSHLKRPLVLVDPKSANPSDPIHGKCGQGDYIVVVHDVLLTGRRIADVVDALRTAGATVEHVFALIERTDARRIGEELPTITLGRKGIVLHTIMSLDDDDLARLLS